MCQWIQRASYLLVYIRNIVKTFDLAYVFNDFLPLFVNSLCEHPELLLVALGIGSSPLCSLLDDPLEFRVPWRHLSLLLRQL